MSRFIHITLAFSIALCFVACQPTDPIDDVVQSEMSKSAKRGVAFNFPTVDDAQALSPYISWDYNWGPNISYDVISMWFDYNDVQFCPMAWNQSFNAERIRNYVKAHPSCKYLLGFNEPNLTDQCNLTPQQAALYWRQVVALAKELNLKLVAPAMNYGTLDGYSDPIKWLDDFFAIDGINLDDIDVISLHCYMGNSAALMGFVDRFDKYGKPIWMTEFCGWGKNINSQLAQINYMCEVLNYFEQTDKIERYSWFIPRASGPVNSYPYMQMLEKSSSDLTDLGKVYCMFSSFDKSAWLKSPVRASDYVATSDYNVHLLPSTCPNDSKLMVNALRKGQILDYQVFLPTDISTMQIHYASFADSQIVIYVDDQPLATTIQAATGASDTWATTTLPLALSAGKHTVRLAMLDGTCNLSFFEFQ